MRGLQIVCLDWLLIVLVNARSAKCLSGLVANSLGKCTVCKLSVWLLIVLVGRLSANCLSGLVANSLGKCAVCKFSVWTGC